MLGIVDAGAGAGGDVKTFTQEQINVIVQDRLSREREKFSDYEDLKKFRTEHEKKLDETKQKELEAAKQYEELKKGWDEKENKYKSALSDKDTAIKGLKIDHSLSREIATQNAYPEVLDVLKNQVFIGDDGAAYMKGRDQVGNEINISLTDGVKKFLEARPHLVKGNTGAGGGTAAAAAAGAAGAGETLEELNEALVQAKASGNVVEAKKVSEKIKTFFVKKGISRSI
jgi:hypothetical protein